MYGDACCQATVFYFRLLAVIQIAPRGDNKDPLSEEGGGGGYVCIKTMHQTRMLTMTKYDHSGNDSFLD